MVITMTNYSTIISNEAIQISVVDDDVLNHRIPSITIYDDAVLSNGNSSIVSKRCLKEIIDKLTDYYNHYDDYFDQLYAEKYEAKTENLLSLEHDPVKQTHKERSGYVYIMKNMGVYKIGRCNVGKARLGEYTKLPEEPDYVMMMYVSDCYMVESKLHEMFADKRMRDGTCEWFKLSKKDIEEACQYSIQFMIPNRKVLY